MFINFDFEIKRFYLDYIFTFLKLNFYCLISNIHLGIYNLYRPWDDLHKPHERDEGALWLYARSGENSYILIGLFHQQINYFSSSLNANTTITLLITMTSI